MHGAEVGRQLVGQLDHVHGGIAPEAGLHGHVEAGPKGHAIDLQRVHRLLDRAKASGHRLGVLRKRLDEGARGRPVAQEAEDERGRRHLADTLRVHQDHATDRLGRKLSPQQITQQDALRDADDAAPLVGPLPLRRADCRGHHRRHHLFLHILHHQGGPQLAKVARVREDEDELVARGEQLDELDDQGPHAHPTGHDHNLIVAQHTRKRLLVKI